MINTCAGRIPRPDVRSSGRQPYEQRAFALRNFILPRAVEDGAYGEVIVVGEWEPGEGYKYIPVKSEYYSCVDALAQRHVGAEYARGEWICFQHDDHIIDYLPYIQSGADVVVPERWTRLRRGVGERLNNGEDDGYISGHCAFYRREVLLAAPWRDVPKVHTWDEAHTQQILAAGFHIEWVDNFRVWDCERGASRGAKS